MSTTLTQDVTIPSGEVHLEGEINLPARAAGIVLFAHGSGSSRHSPRNKHVAQILQQAGLGTLLFDLLTRQEEAIDLRTAGLRFDIDLLADRLIDATRWIKGNGEIGHLNVGYFGASTASRPYFSQRNRPALTGASMQALP